MTTKRTRRVYFPPVAEELAIDAETRLLGSSFEPYTGSYGVQHTNSTTQEDEDGLTITRDGNNSYGSAVW